MNPINHAIHGAATAGLTNAQKRAVVILARRAWEKLGRPEYADQPTDAPEALRLSVSDAFNLWRQNQQRVACGRLHLTAADQRDYPIIMAHFKSLAGHTEAADRWTYRAATDDTRRALGKLRIEIKHASDVIEDPDRYVASIANSKYKTRDIQTLTPRQIWVLCMDIRRAASRRRSKLTPPF